MNGQHTEKQCSICDIVQRYLSAEFHGTGDAFDGVLIASILKGCSLKESMIEAHRFVYACMEESLKMEYEEREGLMIEKNLYMLV